MKDSIEFSKCMNLCDIEKKLTENAYIQGDSISDADWDIFKVFKYPPCSINYPKTHFWYNKLKLMKPE